MLGEDNKTHWRVVLPMDLHIRTDWSGVVRRLTELMHRQQSPSSSICDNGLPDVHNHLELVHSGEQTARERIRQFQRTAGIK
jgi:hypothetical protein